jgi:hypothetical protein
MRKLLLPLFTLLLLFISTSEINANVYASGLRISDESVTDYNLAGNTWDENFLDGSKLKIWFIINESGGGTLTSEVKIYLNLQLVRTLNVTSPEKGVNSVIWDGFKDDLTPAPQGNYIFRVTVSDPVGHAAFDSVWVASAFYQGPDPDGLTAFAYRGNASVMDVTSPAFGSLYVARGTTSGVNGFYKYRADGVYLSKVGTDPTWPNSTPNEVTAIKDKLFGLAGYGFAGGGFALGFNQNSNVFADSVKFNNINVRGLTSRQLGSTTTLYSTYSVSGIPAVVKKVGENGPVDTLFSLSPYILTTSGYAKAVAVDDDENIYVAFGDASASRKKIGKFSQTGNLLWLDSLDRPGGLTAGSYFHSIAIYHGENFLTASDDKLYALVYSGTLTQWGIYEISTHLTTPTFTQLISPLGRGTGATSQIINVDAAGNVIWSNGNASERIVKFSPAGPNSFTTQNPIGYGITVMVPIPVELTSLTASVSGKDVILNWSTATETNNKGFEVERNTGNGWSNIGFVEGNGTTTLIMKYQYIDKGVSGKISYRLKQIDYDGAFKYSAEVEADVAAPDGYHLSQNYPNPFNPVTNISFRVPVDSRITLEVYSLSGELVATLADDFRTAGEYSVSFDASKLSSGTYLYRLTSGEIVITKKMLLVK